MIGKIIGAAVTILLVFSFALFLIPMFGIIFGVIGSLFK